jgi:uncharacterized protein (TIGR02266 family)
MNGPPEHDRRRHPRIPISLVVRLRFSSLSQLADERALNLSPAGMFIQTPTPPAIGAMVFLQFSLADGAQLIEGVAEVVRTVPAGGSEPSGFAVKFREFDPTSLALIQALCERKANEVKWKDPPADESPAPQKQ